MAVAATSSSPPRAPVDIVVSQDFFPMIGGAHHWLYETYRRWPTPVSLVARDFDGGPAEIEAQKRFDADDHGSLRIVRTRNVIDEIDLLGGDCRRRFGRLAAEIGALRAGAPATLHCLRAFPEGFAGLLAKLRRPFSTRLVVFAHGEEMLIAAASRQLKLMAAAVYRFADLVIANSQNTIRLLKEICPSVKAVCVHPGVDVAKFSAAEGVAALRARWGWPDGTVVVSTIARMEPRKNQAAVIRAVAALRREGMPIACVCGGDGEERGNLERLVRELGVEPWVYFAGRMSEQEKVQTYLACDFFAMPSVRVGSLLEGFGIVFMEAAAAGKPAISGCEGGQPEAVVDGVTGLVVDGADGRAVQDAIARLARDRVLREKMGSAAAQRVRAFDWPEVSRAVFMSVQDVAGALKGVVRA
jgi:phosphatidylinositol alpha-1,6-mannosyltransferase